MITIYIKISHLQYVSKLNLIIVIFYAVCIQTVIEVCRVFDAAFININLY